MILGLGLSLAQGLAKSVSLEGCLFRLSLGDDEREQWQGFKLTGGPDGETSRVGVAKVHTSKSESGSSCVSRETTSEVVVVVEVDSVVCIHG